MKLCEPESLNKHYMSIYTKKKKKKTIWNYKVEIKIIQNYKVESSNLCENTRTCLDPLIKITARLFLL